MHRPRGLRKIPAHRLVRLTGGTARPLVAMVFAASVLGASRLGAQGARPDTTGTLVGSVIMRDGGLPLAYSVVSINAPAREQFSDERGAFTIIGLPAGRVRVRVRHVGFTPADVDVTIRAGLVDTVRVALSRIAVRLNAVQVRAFPACENPGAPRASADSAFAMVFEQLRQNAEQFRLLTSAYPFVYAMERVTGVTFGRRFRRDGIDTIVVRSADPWQYQPGTVVTQQRRRFRPDGPVMMRIPTLAHFADSNFIANHCFYSGGVESVDGRDLLRIDFVAARIAAPDVDGAMYLDTATFQIRRSYLRLSRMPKSLPDVLETEATTVFSDLLPSVPIISAIESVSHLKPIKNQFRPPSATNENQRLVAVEFTGRRPGDDARTPAPASAAPPGAPTRPPPAYRPIPNN